MARIVAAVLTESEKDVLFEKGFIRLGSNDERVDGTASFRAHRFTTWVLFILVIDAER